MEYLEVCNAVESALKKHLVRASMADIDRFIDRYYSDLVGANSDKIIHLWNDK